MGVDDMHNSIVEFTNMSAYEALERLMRAFGSQTVRDAVDDIALRSGRLPGYPIHPALNEASGDDERE